MSEPEIWLCASQEAEVAVAPAPMHAELNPPSSSVVVVVCWTINHDDSGAIYSECLVSLQSTATQTQTQVRALLAVKHSVRTAGPGPGGASEYQQQQRKQPAADKQTLLLSASRRARQQRTRRRLTTAAAVERAHGHAICSSSSSRSRCSNRAAQPPTTRMALEHASVHVRDITAILRVDVAVASFQYDASIMRDPEFLITTRVVFQCREHGGRALETTWHVYRAFHEFYGLDTQLRAAFPLRMVNIRPPRLHKRRTLLRLHKTRTFLTRRCHELHTYVQALLAHDAHMRLSRFLDPRAPLVLRCFCNFDAGFGHSGAVLCTSPVDEPTLRLDNILETEARESAADARALAQVADADASVRSQEHELQQQQAMREQWRADHLTAAGSQLDELEANLLDDRARGMAMCQLFECPCQYATLAFAQARMVRILALRGLEQRYAPRAATASALFCVLFELQQYNDLDKRLYDALTGIPVRCEHDTYDEAREQWVARHAQLTQGVAIVRQAMANYGLLFVGRLAEHLRTSTVDLTKKLHAMKSERALRAGALELALLATMLDLSLTLVTDDHCGTEVRVEPLAELEPIRRGGRIRLTLGYMLPTLANVYGFYVLAALPELPDASAAGDPPHSLRRRLSLRVMQADAAAQAQREREAAEDAADAAIAAQRSSDDTETSDSSGWESSSALADPAVRRRRRMWLGVEEMDRCLIAAIDAQMRSELAWLASYDDRVAESLNKAILDAVWDDCQHNPKLFYLFQRQARQFGRARTSATFFVQYLEVAFGMEGAMYLVDFLLHVLPEEALRKQLVRARWFRVRRHLLKRVSPASPRPLPQRRASDVGVRTAKSTTTAVVARDWSRRSVH